MSEQNQDLQVAAQELAAKVSQPKAQPQAQPVEKIGEIPVTQFNAALKEVVGIEDYKAIEGLKGYQTKARELEQKLKETEAKLSVNPYPNELVERLAKMYQSGEEDAKIKQWLQIHTMDFSNSMEVIKQKIQLENPRYTKEMVNDVIEEMFGGEPNKDDEQYEFLRQKRDTKIQRAAIEAEEFLKSQLAGTSNPDAEKQKVERQQKQQALSQAWGSVVESVISNTNPLRFEIDDKNIGGKYFFEFNPPKDDNLSKVIRETLVNQAVNQNIPLNEDGLKSLMNLQQNLLWNIHREEFIKQMAFDIYASIQEANVKARAKPEITMPVKQQQPRARPEKKGFPMPDRRTGMV